jgi:hypothetical protein
LTLLHDLLKEISSPEENEYLKEAVGCAKNKHFRAAVVLGWSATIDRIHKKIENLGFSNFNMTAANIASQTKGRYKKFGQIQLINSISDLRELFDNKILWVIEAMGLIDINQHTRLKSCFDMRCQCSHPGDAPITEWNLLSFFSDIKEIVLKNNKFQIQ